MVSRLECLHSNFHAIGIKAAAINWVLMFSPLDGAIMQHRALGFRALSNIFKIFHGNSTCSSACPEIIRSYVLLLALSNRMGLSAQNRHFRHAPYQVFHRPRSRYQKISIRAIHIQASNIVHTSFWILNF